MKSGLNVLYYWFQYQMKTNNISKWGKGNSFGEIFAYLFSWAIVIRFEIIWTGCDVDLDKAPQSDFHISDFPSDKGKGESY